jgi:hypothetical protein
MTTVHPRRPARKYGPDEDPAVAETDAVLEALSLRKPAASLDAMVGLLSALIDDVDQQWPSGPATPPTDQRRSSVSITPST